MFIHNFKYTLKTLFGNKILIFWTFAFPIIMATFFNLAFSNIENSEKLSIIDIAIVESEEFKNNMCNHRCLLKTELYNSIPKEKVKEKIEELSNTKGDFATYIATSERIKVLQELMEEK